MDTSSVALSFVILLLFAGAFFVSIKRATFSSFERKLRRSRNTVRISSIVCAILYALLFTSELDRNEIKTAFEFHASIMNGTGDSIRHLHIQDTCAYRLNLPRATRPQPRPNHWFHFIEFHLPLTLLETKVHPRKSPKSSNMLLLLPARDWMTKLTPMSRFLLAATYSVPAAHEATYAQSPRSIYFATRDDVAYTGNDDDVESDVSVITRCSHVWSSTYTY